VLRDVLGMTGTQFGRDLASCGACMVQIDGTPRLSRSDRSINRSEYFDA
jgi:aerobic-type carbon monoxide dehydrogenase small subunit (CoxS/CutS family)